MDDVPAVDGTLAPDTRFGKYRIVRLIGSGGMGAVYEAVHTELEKRVAIKVLLRSAARKDDLRTRFLREGRATARIRHPNVVDVHDVDTHDGVPFMVMEYLEGEDLGKFFDRRGALPVEEVVDLMLPVLAAVATGHEAGVIHRDIKPQNIFLERGAHGALTPKLLDFGISKLVEPDSDGRTVTGTGASFGTAAYLSPERAMGVKHGGERSDQYALGLVVYEGVTGQRAHEDENILALIRQISDGRLVPPRQHRPSLSVELEQVVLRALSLKPEDRYPSIYAFARALLPFASERGRMLWTETLARAAGEGAAAAVAPAAPEAPATPPPPTRLLTTGGPPVTTLRSFATSPGVAPPAARRRMLWLVAAGGIALGAATVLLLARANPAPVPAGSVAPAATAPVIVPPPAVAPAAVAPVPPRPAPDEPAVPEPAASAAPPAVAEAPVKKGARPANAAKPRPRRSATAAPATAAPAPGAKPKTGANNALILE